MSRKYCTVLLPTIVSLLITGIVYAGPLDDCKEYIKYGVPGVNGDILCRTGYLIAHDPYCLTPFWTAEYLTSQKASGTLKRKDSFKADPDLQKGHRSELSDYKGSGYDRGHMVPSGDMAWDEQAMQESFYLSNMVPQDPKMNQVIWSNLEGKVREWAKERGELYIYTGPIYDQDQMDTIGDDQVCIPTHIYKIIFDPVKAEAITFIMPNAPLNTSDMPNYIASVRDVEDKTGLDFLSVLNKPVQDVVETKKAPSLWQ